jgi:hypothetical protein
VSTDTNSTKPAPSRDDDAPETPDERRMINLLIIGIILLVFGAAFWLGDALLDARRADECMASGRSNCDPITAPAPPPR